MRNSWFFRFKNMILFLFVILSFFLAVVTLLNTSVLIMEKALMATVKDAVLASAGYGSKDRELLVAVLTFSTVLNCLAILAWIGLGVVLLRYRGKRRRIRNLLETQASPNC